MHIEHGRDGLIRASLPLYDTIVCVQAACEPSVLDVAFARLRRYEALFSRTLPTSDVSRIHDSAGVPVKVAPETAELLGLALDAARQTDGALDITVGAVTRLWDFHGAGCAVDDAEITGAASHIGYGKLHVQGRTAWLDDPAASLDLGGVAKGYIADKIAEYLRECGCTSACIDLGGNIYALGTRPDGAPWRVGVADPLDAGAAPVATIELQDEALVTSATTLRSVGTGSERQSHIFNPKTGEPCKTDLLAVSVLAPTAFEAEALSTPLVMWGAPRAVRELRARPHLQALLLCADGRAAQTPGNRFNLCL